MKKIIVLSLLAIGFISCNAKKAVVENVKNESTSELSAPIIPLTAELAAGKSIFEAKCGKCHDMPVPNHYTKEKWTPIMNSMAKKAKISDEEKALVYNYVTMNL